MSTVEVVISGMHCQGCADSITNSLRLTTGVGEARVDLGSRRARVIYDEAVVTVGALFDAVRRAGYQVDGFTTLPEEHS